MTTGQRIRQARKANKLSQKELADKLGVSASMVGQYENDLRNPKFETLKKIAGALNMSPIELLDERTSSFVEYGRDLFVQALRKSEDAIKNGDHEFELEGYKVDIQYDSESTNRRKELLEAFSQLNEEGQCKAVERVSELSEIPKYQKDKPPQE